MRITNLLTTSLNYDSSIQRANKILKISLKILRSVRWSPPPFFHGGNITGTFARNSKKKKKKKETLHSCKPGGNKLKMLDDGTESTRDTCICQLSSRFRIKYDSIHTVYLLLLLCSGDGGDGSCHKVRTKAAREITIASRVRRG